ncbi:DUSP10 [Mytilus edulis]|uniref:DUSP10 n=1 Tax=Mytilus edulis TaxID=6550 RepID=A0A8S3RGK1_MYTED|nr:DUSP10 [Mytilus edulis]
MLMYDILIFLESKTDEFDILGMPDGYKYFAKHRTKFKKKSGGIIICFKSNLEKFLKFPKSNSEFVQWVVLEKGLVDFNKNLLMGCMYLPPENTKYTSNEAFIEVEIEMIELVNKYDGQPLIVGDLNAKTKLLDDVVIPDDGLFDILDDFEDDSFVSYLYDYQNLCDNNVSLKRCSKDGSVPNNYGYKLIDFCKRNNLYIGNSRLPGNDYMIGLTTCNSVSLIDYLLLSSNIFSLIKEFNVLEFNPLFSDVHCGLCFCFHASVNIFTTHSDDNCSSQRGHARWVPDKENRFIETLASDVTKLDEISLLLSEDSSDPKERINTVVDKICDIFKSTASRVFKPKGRSYLSGSSNQLWFNKQCRDKRKFSIKRKTVTVLIKIKRTEMR